MLIPCALNETKISFVLLGALFILLLSSRQQFYRTVPLLLVGLLLAFLLNYYYTETVEDTSNIFDEQYIEQYLVTNPTETGGDLPRFQRIFLMFKLMKGDVGSYLLGIGYGIMGGGNVMGVSRLGRSLYYLVTGSRILLFRVWIQGGFLAVLNVLALLFASYRVRPRSSHTLRQFYRYLLFTMIVIWAYNEAILDRLYAASFWFMMEWVIAGGRDGEEYETASESDVPAEIEPTAESL
jgi:hypothetical protein